jgi:hypothetical protein
VSVTFKNSFPIRTFRRSIGFDINVEKTFATTSSKWSLIFGQIPVDEFQQSSYSAATEKALAVL